MTFDGRPLGVCSWSLKPSGMPDLVRMLKELQLQHLQLSLGELVQLDDKRREEELSVLRNSGINLTAGMIAFPGEDYSTIDIIRQTGGFVPDDAWPARRALALECARLAIALDTKTVSTHVGFIPHATDAEFKTIVDRTKAVADDFASLGVDLLMETGPEPARDMLIFIEKVRAPNLFVNFDPANMILYGAGDPLPALKLLAPHVRHVHLKDAVASLSPGIAWGREVVFGTGQVGAQAFFSALKQIGYAGPLVIEREAGESRLADVRAAIEVCELNS